MDESFTLRRITVAALPRALEKAERYRLLNEPEEAESICRDVLVVDAANQRALVILVLAISDQFRVSGGRFAEARECVGCLTDPYERAYYEGLAREREGRGLLGRPHGAAFAFDCFRSAMDCYERAITLSPANDDEAILRWNACVRTIQRSHLAPRPDEPELLLE